MNSPETYVHPVESHLPRPFVKSLVDAELLPFDIAFRSQWIPYEITEPNGTRTLRSEILEQDILSVTGHMEPSKYFDSYLSASAEPPACVTISYYQNAKDTIASAGPNWHAYTDYRQLLQKSGMRYVDTKAQTTWLRLIHAMLYQADETLDWVQNSDPGDIAKRTHAGGWLRNQIARTVIRDSAMLYLSDAPYVVPDTTFKVKTKTFDGLQILLARTHSDLYEETYA
ncbi:MAG: hypothetical protein WAS36_04470, partial [Candidatus Saccharimonadales bacterium]